MAKQKMYFKLETCRFKDYCVKADSLYCNYDFCMLK